MKIILFGADGQLPSQFERTFGYAFAPWQQEIEAAMDDWPKPSPS